MPKIRTFGMYVGAMVDPSFDWDGNLKKVAEAGYNSFSVFMTTAFFNTEFWPWPVVNNHLRFSQDNEAFYAHYRRSLLASEKHQVRLHLCFVDQFHSIKDNPELDPFRDGLNQGIDWDEEPLYSSLTLPDGVFHWIKWDDLPGGKYGNFRPVSVFGAAMMRFLRRISLITRTVKLNHPDLPIPSWKWANETAAVKMPDGKVVNYRGDRDEIFSYVTGLWKAAGLEGDRYIDYTCTNWGEHKGDPHYVAYDVVHEAFVKGIRGKHKAKLETHNILTVADCLKYPVDNRFTKFSTDGDLQMVAEYSELGHSPLPDVDLKFDFKKSDPKPSSAQQMFDWYFHRYKDYV